MAVAGEALCLSDLKSSMESLQRDSYVNGMACTKLPPGCVAPPIVDNFLKDISATQTDLVHAFDIFYDEECNYDLDVVKMLLERPKPDYKSLPGVLAPKDDLPQDSTMQLAIIDIPDKPTHKVIFKWFTFKVAGTNTKCPKAVISRLCHNTPKMINIPGFYNLGSCK